MADWRDALFPPADALPPVDAGADLPAYQAPEAPDVELPLDEWGYGQEPTLGYAEPEPMPYDLGPTNLEHRAMPSELAGAPATSLLDEAASGGEEIGQAALPDATYREFGQSGMGPSIAQALGYEAETPLEIADRFTEEERDEQALAAPEDALEGMTLEAVRRRRELKRQAKADELEAEQAKVSAQQRLAEAEKAQAEQDLWRETEEEMAAYRDEWAAISQRETDPDRWMNSRSTGQKIGAYIGAALQGWLNPTGPNSVVDLMERAINRDIEAQARDLANQRAGMSQQMSLLQWNYNKTGDIIAAAHSSKAAILRQKAADVIAEAAKFDQGGTQAEDAELLFREQLAKADAEERAALEAMRESKRKQRMEDELHASKLADAQAGRASKYAGIARGKEGSQREDRKLDEAQAEREAKQARLSRDPLYDAIHRAGGDPEKDRDKFAAVSFPNGRVEVIRTTEPAKTEAYFNAARDMVQGFDEILGMRDAAGRWTLSSEDLAKQMQSVYGMMTLDAKNFFDLGAITEADATLIERVIGGDPNAIRDFTALLDKSRSQLENKVRGRLENAQVKGAGEFGYPKLEPARGESKMPGDFRKEIRGGMKLGTLEDVTGSIDEAIRVMSEGGTGKNHDYFLGRIVKDAKAAGRDDVVDYARSLMK